MGSFGFSNYLYLLGREELREGRAASTQWLCRVGLRSGVSVGREREVPGEGGREGGKREERGGR